MRNRTKNKSIAKNKSAGFSLMEMVVVMAVFSTTAIIAVDLFLAVTKVQRQVRSVQSVQSDARFALEAMAREIRMGTIDYEYYQNNCIAGENTGDPCTEDTDCISGGANSCWFIDLSIPTDILATRDQDNRQFFYRVNDDNLIEICNNSYVDLTRCNIGAGTNNWQTVSPPDVKINSLKFYIFPATNPFSTEAISCTDLGLECEILGGGECKSDGFCTFDFQPMVTISLESESINEKESEKVNLQTTVTSMFYHR